MKSAKMKKINQCPPRSSPFKFFPCLRCGQLKVVALIPIWIERLGLGDLICADCGTCHFLVAEKSNGTWWAIYDRDTRRYPSECYDEIAPPAIVKIQNVDPSRGCDDEAPFVSYGPIMVFKRKRFSAAEVETIWTNSRGRCHLCQKKWRLKQRSKKGWHIDHVIPNCGGGRDTEAMSNFRVACARCNLKKGGGDVQLIKEALLRLFA
jgi:5-methylcytosine-specific restriction endonuclease McrA